MKRDWNLIRLLLLEIESRVAPEALKQYTEEQVLYHCELLEESGLILGKLVRGGKGQVVGASIQRLTWKGHDLLDSIRDEGVWARVQSMTKAAAGSATAEMLMEASRWVVSAALGAAVKAATRP